MFDPLSVIANVPPPRSIVEVLGSHGWIVVVSFLVSAAATPIVRAMAMRYRIVDKPDNFLKPHARPIAYLGGVAIYLGWLAGMLLALPAQWAGRHWLFGLMAAGGIIMLVGLIDDLLKIKPGTKLLGQAIAATALLVFGIGTHFCDPFLSSLAYISPDWLQPYLHWPGWLVTACSIPLAIFIVLAASNATNLLDGMDGLCSGVTGVIAISFLALAVHLATYNYSPQHDQVRIIVTLAMFGSVCGFLPYNTKPATIFLGDAGSLLLGLYAAAMILMFGERDVLRWVLGAVMIFGLPILDTSLALLRRLRLHRPIFGGDRSHLYDQLVDRGFSVRQTVMICYGLAAFYGGVGLATMYLHTWQASILYAVIILMTLTLCWKLGFLKPPVATPGEQKLAEATAQK